MRTTALLALVAAAALAGCATVSSRVLQPLGLASPPGYAYDVRLTGVGGRLLTRIEDVSELILKKGAPPATLQGLRRRTLADRDLFLRVMRSRGWYDGSVAWEIDTVAKKPLVVLRVSRGKRFVLSKIDIEGLPPDSGTLAKAEGLATLGLRVADPALAETVLAAENGLVVALATRGYPYAVLALREARIDRSAKTMELLLRVDAGPLTRFGEVRVEGLTGVEAGYIRRRVKFQRGEVYSPAKVEETRKALCASGVFGGCSVGLGNRADVGADGEAPVLVTVTEGKMHSVGLGLKYSSADGPGGKAFWENRNFFGRADRLRAEVQVAKLIATGGVSYRLPDWLRTDQSLLFDAAAESDKPPAYDRYALGVSAGVERPLSLHLVGTAGLVLEQSDVNSAADTDGTKRFTLLGLPLGLRYDGSDNLLDPSRGHRTQVGMTPYFSLLGDNVQMASMKATESFYVPLDDRRRNVWATRVTLASVIGPERNDIPADKRLYAGGGDSVRGYEFQYVGPLRDMDPTKPTPTGKPDYKPEGGRSLLQVGTELRWKVTETFGLVPFVEGAGVYESSYPDFGEQIQWAAGLGLRYFTVAGPIRFDVGFPLNPRPSDSLFQVYISLGQAF